MYIDNVQMIAFGQQIRILSSGLSGKLCKAASHAAKRICMQQEEISKKPRGSGAECKTASSAAFFVPAC
jgi:hypothetical protein